VHHPPHIAVPNLRHTLRHALPNVVEGKLIPVALFVGFLELVGNVAALLIALGWALGAIGYRRATGRRVPGLVVLSTIALTARTIAALATGSMLVYFLQPTITTVLVGVAFMASVPLGNPLAQKLAYDILPFDDDTKAHPLVRQFFVRLSLIWSVTSLVNASITIWLLLTQSTTTFVLVKSVLGPATAAVTLSIGFAWLWSALRRTGTRLVWQAAPPSGAAVAPA
jgi:hypothetical protein